MAKKDMTAEQADSTKKKTSHITGGGEAWYKAREYQPKDPRKVWWSSWARVLFIRAISYKYRSCFVKRSNWRRMLSVGIESKLNTQIEHPKRQTNPEIAKHLPAFPDMQCQYVLYESRRSNTAISGATTKPSSLSSWPTWNSVGP